MSKQIQLTQNQSAIVSDEDFEYLNQFKWFAAKYAGSFYANRQENKKIFKMHDVIAERIFENDNKNDSVLDHKDRNTLNNQRDNLRKCSKQQNTFNRSKSINKSSIYKGVIFRKDKKNKSWQARITFNGKVYSLGFYIFEILAAEAYNLKAVEFFGEFAAVNEVDYRAIFIAHRNKQAQPPVEKVPKKKKKSASKVKEH